MVVVPAELSNVLSGSLFEAVALIEPNKLTAAERTVIPDWWIEAVHLSASDGLAHAVGAWQSALPDALPTFYGLLGEHGVGVFLGRSASENKPLLAYAVTLPSGDTVCWYGFPPTEKLGHPTLDLAALPAGPLTLYTQLHDGFRLASPFHNGFPSSAELFAVGEDLDPDSADIVGDSAAPDLNRLVSLHFDVGASSVCVELADGSTEDSNGWVFPIVKCGRSRTGLLHE